MAECKVEPDNCSDLFRAPGLSTITLWLQKLRIDLLIPGVQHAAHLLDALWVLGCQVFALTDVQLEIVQMHLAIFETFDELPVVHPNRASWEASLVGVMRIMPIDGIPLNTRPAL